MKYNAKPAVRSNETDQKIGLNNLVTDKVLIHIYNDFISLESFIKDNGIKVLIFISNSTS